jgi:hypothetical protein
VEDSKTNNLCFDLAFNSDLQTKRIFWEGGVGIKKKKSLLQKKRKIFKSNLIHKKWQRKFGHGLCL